MAYLNIVKNINPNSGLTNTKLIDDCFNSVNQTSWFMPDWILSMDGMSGRKYRQLINMIVSRVENARYLEIGVWQGSTLCSAIWNNTVTAIACDNWSQFEGPRDKFFKNLNSVKTDKNHVTVMEQDFRTIEYSDIGKFNIYMFDGPHEEQDQYDGVVAAIPALDNEFVLIVDDWNHPNVKNGTQRAIADLGLIVDSISIDTSIDGSHPSPVYQYSDWHNGYFIASVKKPD